MWKPNEEGLQELLNLFKDSKSIDNKKQSEIYTKINEYSSHQEFSKYLVYILNSEKLEQSVRQVAGLTLKGMMERSFVNLSEDAIEYFKENILLCYLDESQTIRKTISNLINTFIRLGGMEMWPEILDFLLDSLDTELGVGMSLETLNIIIEDSGAHLEEKFSKFLQQLLLKLTNFLEKMAQRQAENRNDELLVLVLCTIYVLLENCPNTMNDDMKVVTNLILNLHQSQNVQIRYHLGRCWLTIVRMRKEILVTLLNELFSFYINNLSVEHYEMNFISAEFFLFILEEGEDEFLKEENVTNLLHQNLKQLINYFLHYMKLTPSDMCGVENKPKTSKGGNTTMTTTNGVATGTIGNTTTSSGITNEETNDGEEEEEGENSEGYNPNWTLRKCCSKVLDKLSNFSPQKVYELAKPILENDMQHSDWLVKERSILALGAIGVGSYSFLRPHLSNLISFLIRELQHPHKLVRAISCWTLSRFTKFILIDNLSDNSYELFKDYLCEVLKKFLDREIIVQEAACSAFSNMIVTKKEKLEPYLFDIFKIISSVFSKYNGTSLLTLYEIITLLTEYYPNHFKNMNLIEELVNCVIKRWYEMVKSQDYKNLPPLFEMLISIIKVSDSIMTQYFEYFLNGSLVIIENTYNLYVANNNDTNLLDRELLSKSIDLISVLCQQYPVLVRENNNKNKIVDYIFILFETNDYYLKHYLIALIGDLAKADFSIFTSRFDKIMNKIFVNLEFPETSKFENYEMEKLSICNNSCWTIGLLAISYPEQTKVYVIPILRKLLKMLTVPRLNKSLAQNISICLGRLSLIDPVNISNYLDSFLKQFCLSLRYIKDSPEKIEAFHGLCKAIVHNPNGVMNFFAFFCDAICQYDDAPEDLEGVFQNIILSYKNTLREKWMDYFKLFPDKLKMKMTERFKL